MRIDGGSGEEARCPLRCFGGTNAHDKSRNRHVNDAVSRRFAKHLRCVIVDGG